MKRGQPALMHSMVCTIGVGFLPLCGLIASSPLVHEARPLPSPEAFQLGEICTTRSDLQLLAPALSQCVCANLLHMEKLGGPMEPMESCMRSALHVQQARPADSTPSWEQNSVLRPDASRHQ